MNANTAKAKSLSRENLNLASRQINFINSKTCTRLVTQMIFFWIFVR